MISDSQIREAFQGLLTKAIDSLMTLTWADFQGQVLEFLDADRRKEYGTREAWESLQIRVLEALQAHA